MREDVISLTINRTAAQFGFGRIFWGCMGVALFGLILLTIRRTRKAGLVVSCVGFAAGWLALLCLTLAEVKEQTSPHITVFRNPYGQHQVNAAYWGMIAIPAGATLVMLGLWRLAARRRKARLPIHLRDGLKAFFQKDYDLAIKELSTAIAIDRDRAESYNRRGQVHQALGNLDMALTDFNKAIDLQPELASAYRQRGMVFASRDDLDLALNDFEFALKLDMTDCATILQRGLCLARLGRRDRAVEELRRVLQMSNHSDYADPAREQLKRLGALD